MSKNDLLSVHTPVRPNLASTGLHSLPQPFASIRMPSALLSLVASTLHQSSEAFKRLGKAWKGLKICQNWSKLDKNGTAAHGPWGSRPGVRGVPPVPTGQGVCEGTRLHRWGSFKVPQSIVKSRQKSFWLAPWTDFGASRTPNGGPRAVPRTWAEKGGTHALHIDRFGCLGGPGGLAIKGFPHAQKSPF